MYRPIHLWAPDLWRTRGGIQTYLLGVIKALREIYPETRIIVFSMNDHAVLENYPKDPLTEFHCLGGSTNFWSRVRFCLSAFTVALFERPRFLINGHVHFCSIAYFLNLALKVPYYSLSYGLDIWGWRSRFFRHTLDRSRKIISISGYTARRIHLDHEISMDRICLLPCTLDTGRFLPKPKPQYLSDRYKLGQDEQVILMVCRLASAERYKGYDILIDLIPRLLPLFPKLRFFIAGRGADFDRVSARVSAAGLADHIQLLGFVPDDELCDLYNLCDVFAMPSKGEGFGIVFLEALACGKPVLAGDQDGSKDAVLNGRIGYLVNPDDPQEIAEALRVLLSGKPSDPNLVNPDFLRKMVIENFGYDRFVKTLSLILR